MAVLLETSKGDMVVDLYVEDCPNTCKNFLKLCKIKYYNNCIFHNVQQNFIVQTGDPTATGKGGESIYGIMYGDQARFFDDEIHPHLKHTKRGLLGMASAGPNLNASQFYITTGEALDSLDEKHTVFGAVSEGLDVLMAINEAFVDEAGRPYQNIRIRHTIILDDPFDDPAGLEDHMPDASPEPQFGEGDRLEDDWKPQEDTRPPEEVEEETRKAEAHNRAVVLEMIGDLPEADVKPPSNMLFVCKLNPVTTEEDLEIIFSRFGNVTSCDIIRDWKTGDSLCYAFIGFDTDAVCEEAYFKMNNVLIDDRRIKVDFSQSVHHIWKQFRARGKKGDAALMQAADTHTRGGNAGPGANLEYTGQRGGTGPAGPSGRNGGHALLLGHAPSPAAAPHQPPRRQQPPHRGEQQDDRSRRRQKHSRSRSPEHGRSSHKQHRHSSRDRDRDRGREHTAQEHSHRQPDEQRRGSDRRQEERHHGSRGNHDGHHEQSHGDGGGRKGERQQGGSSRDEQRRRERSHERRRDGSGDRRRHDSRDRARQGSRERVRPDLRERRRERDGERERGSRDRDGRHR